MGPFSSLFLLDSATLSFASMAAVVYGYVDPQEFRLLGLCFAFCGGSLWALYTPGCFLLVCVLAVVSSCGNTETERLSCLLEGLFLRIDWWFPLGSLHTWTLLSCLSGLIFFCVVCWLRRGQTLVHCSGFCSPCHAFVFRLISQLVLLQTLLILTSLVYSKHVCCPFSLELFSSLPGRTRLVLLV